MNNSQPKPAFKDGMFAGRTAVVTGGAGGIGLAIVRQLVDLQCSVAILDLEPALARLSQFADEHLSNATISIACDLRDPELIDRSISDLKSWRADVDFLVNCAAVFGHDPVNVEEVASDTWRDIFAVNVDGPFALCRALYQSLATSPHGSIVNIGSIAGVTAYPQGLSYGPSKAALISLSHQLAVEWGGAGIRVNVVNPGTVLTPNVRAIHSEESIRSRTAGLPLGRLVSPEEIAAAVIFFLSPAASGITGQVLAVDGGLSMTLMPPRIPRISPRHDERGHVASQ